VQRPEIDPGGKFLVSSIGSRAGGLGESAQEHPEAVVEPVRAADRPIGQLPARRAPVSAGRRLPLRW
jgi:hypothetical protein